MKKSMVAKISIVAGFTSILAVVLAMVLSSVRIDLLVDKRITTNTSDFIYQIQLFLEITTPILAILAIVLGLKSNAHKPITNETSELPKIVRRISPGSIGVTFALFALIILCFDFFPWGGFIGLFLLVPILIVRGALFLKRTFWR